jgi:RNA polymerase sigma factor (sigma-70 family)
MSTLRQEIARGQRLDRDLARELGRSEPFRSASAGDYLESIEARTVLPEAQERELIRRAKSGDAAARAQLVDSFMPVIASAARTYRVGQIERLELLQEGVVGLLRALERYDPERGIPFWGYASHWVRQAMQQLVSELTRPVVLSDRALRHLARLKQAHGEALRTAGTEPGRGELAERTGLSLEQVDALLATDGTPRSLEAPVEGEGGAIGIFGELLADPLAEDEYQRVLDTIELEELHAVLAALSGRERAVLRARYGLDGGEERSLRDVGESVGLSGERVRQIERRALAKLGANLHRGVVKSPPAA